MEGLGRGGAGATSTWKVVPLQVSCGEVGEADDEEGNQQRRVKKKVRNENINKNKNKKYENENNNSSSKFSCLALAHSLRPSLGPHSAPPSRFIPPSATLLSRLACRRHWLLCGHLAGATSLLHATRRRFPAAFMSTLTSSAFDSYSYSNCDRNTCLFFYYYFYC